MYSYHIHLTESKTVKSCEVDHTEEPDMPTNQVEPEIWTCVGTVKQWVTELNVEQLAL